MKKFVGVQHQFHDNECALDWANRFVPTPERLQLFDTIIQQIRETPLPASHIVELGLGPGYLAERLLQHIPQVTYEGLDFSTPMLELAATRLAAHRSRLRFTQADLIGNLDDQRPELEFDLVPETCKYTIREGTDGS